MSELNAKEMSFRQRHEIHLRWEYPAPSLEIAADEAVRSSGEDVALQAAAFVPGIAPR